MYTLQPQRLFKRFFEGRGALTASQLLGDVAQKPLPEPILRMVIALYSLVFGVNTREIEVPKTGFSTFGEFFGRRLRPDARPIDNDVASVVSPCDGEINAFGKIGSAEDAELTVKENHYSLSRLLGDTKKARDLSGGHFLTIYLAPGDYHRVHAPLCFVLSSIRHIPGARYSVAGWSESVADNIYEKNERVVFNGTMTETGAFSLVMVAAFGVGNIESKYHPKSAGNRPGRRQRDINPPVRLSKGDEMGAFLLGSSVVMVWSKGAIALKEDLKLGPIKMGQRIGRIISSDRSKL